MRVNKGVCSPNVLFVTHRIMGILCCCMECSALKTLFCRELTMKENWKLAAGKFDNAWAIMHGTFRLEGFWWHKSSYASGKDAHFGSGQDLPPSYKWKNCIYIRGDCRATQQTSIAGYEFDQRWNSASVDDRYLCLEGTAHQKERLPPKGFLYHGIIHLAVLNGFHDIGKMRWGVSCSQIWAVRFILVSICGNMATRNCDLTEFVYIPI